MNKTNEELARLMRDAGLSAYAVAKLSDGLIKRDHLYKVIHGQNNCSERYAKIVRDICLAHMNSSK